MPEGPSILLLKENVQQFKNQKIIEVSGNSSEDIQRLNGQTIRDFKSWGKHFLICFDDFTVKIHLLMFGTYRVNERKESVPRLRMNFKDGELNFYTCSIKILEGTSNLHYDWSEDVMSKEWDPIKAEKSLKKYPSEMICDAVLDQNIFSGVGNIIKNEVLYRCKIHPESTISKIPITKIRSIIKECSEYSFEFLKWKRIFKLKAHWLAYGQKTCTRCNLPFVKKNTGKRNRKSFFCTNCQIIYK